MRRSLKEFVSMAVRTGWLFWASILADHCSSLTRSARRGIPSRRRRLPRNGRPQHRPQSTVSPAPPVQQCPRPATPQYELPRRPHAHAAARPGTSSCCCHSTAQNTTSCPCSPRSPPSQRANLLRASGATPQTSEELARIYRFITDFQRQQSEYPCLHRLPRPFRFLFLRVAPFFFPYCFVKNLLLSRGYVLVVGIHVVRARGAIGAPGSLQHSSRVPLRRPRASEPTRNLCLAVSLSTTAAVAIWPLRPLLCSTFPCLSSSLILRRDGLCLGSRLPFH